MGVFERAAKDAERRATPPYEGKAPASDTPAKKAERVRGSEQNPKGSAASAKQGEGIEINERTLKALAEKVDAFNDEGGKQVTLGALKAVMRRGMGAFSQSHSPVVKSREQWGMARVNAFLRKKRTGRADNPKYTQDDDLL